MKVSRYINCRIYVAVVVVLLVFLGLFTFFGVADELPNVGKGDFKTKHAFLLVLYTLPGYLYDLMPIAVLIGTIYALAQLAASSEYTIMRVSGYTPSLAIKYLMLPGIVFAGLTYACGESIAPYANDAAQTIRTNLLKEKSAQQLKSGIWVKDRYMTEQSDSATRYVSIDGIDINSALLNVVIREFDSKFRLQRVYQAANAHYLQSGQWQLNQVKITDFLLSPTTQLPERVDIADHTQYLLNSQLTPKLMSALLIAPQKMSIIGLYRYIDHLKENGQSTHRHDIALWKKLTYPLAVFVMLLLALPFGHLHVRSGGVSVKMFIGVLIGVAFYFLTSLLSHAGTLNAWNPIAVSILPLLIGLCVGIISLYRINRR